MPNQIRWEGRLRDGGVLVGQAREILTAFLEMANLVCDGMSVVGYEVCDDNIVKTNRVALITMPQHANHVDLAVGIDDFYSTVKARVMWNCAGLFPEAMGIPTRDRIERIVTTFMFKAPAPPSSEKSRVPSWRTSRTRYQ